MQPKKPKYRTFGELQDIVKASRKEASNKHGPPLDPTFIPLLEAAEQLLTDNEFLQSSLALYEMNKKTSETQK